MVNICKKLRKKKSKYICRKFAKKKNNNNKMIKYWRIIVEICENLQNFAEKLNELDLGEYLQKFAKKKENYLDIGRYLQKFAKKN